MTKIVNLVAVMRNIPDKERRTTQLSEMRTIRDRLCEASDRSADLRALSSALSTIKNADFVARAQQGLAQVASRAAALKKRYDSGSGFERKPADDALTLINEGLDNASSAITKGWRALIDDQTKRYRPLAAAAERAELSGADGLTAAIATLEARRDAPPATAADVDSYRNKAARLPVAIASLGLEGRAGTFMVDASNGRAKARDLQDPDVLAFLKAYPAVWAMLKVGL